MNRRFQFSLRLIFALTAIVAGSCAIWINLPMAVRVAIGAARGALGGPAVARKGRDIAAGCATLRRGLEIT